MVHMSWANTLYYNKRTTLYIKTSLSYTCSRNQIRRFDKHCASLFGMEITLSTGEAIRGRPRAELCIPTMTRTRHSKLASHRAKAAYWRMPRWNQLYYWAPHLTAQRRYCFGTKNERAELSIGRCIAAYEFLLVQEKKRNSWLTCCRNLHGNDWHAGGFIEACGRGRWNTVNGEQPAVNQ